MKGAHLFLYGMRRIGIIFVWICLVFVSSGPVFASLSESPDQVSMRIKEFLQDEDYESAMSEALDLYRLGKAKKQDLLVVQSLETVGHIYYDVSCYEEAAAQFKEALGLLDQLDENREGLTRKEILNKQIPMASLLLESYIYLGRFEEARGEVIRYKELIMCQEELNRAQGDNYPVEREYGLLNSLRLKLSLGEDHMEEAEAVFMETQAFEKSLSSESDHAGWVYFSTLAFYYEKTGNLPMALKYADQALDIERVPEVLRLKADILEGQGRLEDTFALYDEIYAYEEKRNSATFLRQIDQLRTLHRINDQEAQDREWAYSHKVMRQKHNQLLFSLVVIAILSILLYILYRYIIRTQRLKNELQQEKEALQEVEKKLMAQRLKAEEASRMKSVFVANMSHDIRNPLNAIANLSDLLADDDLSPEEKKNYVSQLKNNTTLMLKILSDVLDQSRMED